MEINNNLPLEGIKVLELATVVAAPTAGRMLCAYGAEVIKVESLMGDEMRRAGESEHVICEDYKNPLFTVHNSNKTLTSINLKSPEGMEAFLRLLSTADVFLTNVRMASLARMGLDYDTLAARMPKLIYAHFSGYGPKGPAANNPGFDSTAFWLRSGPIADWQVPGSHPFTPTYAFGDMATSSAFVSGILMALLGKARTGKGTFVTTSLFASGIWCNAVGVVSAQPQFGKVLNPDPLRPADPLCNFYRCRDGVWIGVYDNEYKREREKFAKLYGIPELTDDPRYESLQALAETDAVAECVQKLNEIFATKTSAEWSEYLSANNVACQTACETRNIGEDPQALENGYVEEVEFADGLKAILPCPPVKFSAYDRREYKSTGKVGEDTDKVFASIGYSADEIAEMRKNGAIK
ncbi:MAG: CoA transferase [Oscillospiraceae bacterium]